MTLTHFLSRLHSDHDLLHFAEVLAFIDGHYDFTPGYFKNGNQENPPGQNNGSCKCFAFALLHQLTEAQTLKLFAEHYRHVLEHPNGDDHQNIRQFMQHGWPGLVFDVAPLQMKALGAGRE